MHKRIAISQSMGKQQTFASGVFSSKPNQPISCQAIMRGKLCSTSCFGREDFSVAVASIKTTDMAFSST